MATNFAGSDMQKKNAILLSPHSDDIALSLGASLLGGCFMSKIQLVTVFSISRCTADDSSTNSCIVSKIRKKEDRNFVNTVSQDMKTTWLDREDAPIRLNIADEMVFEFAPPATDLSEARSIQNMITSEHSEFGLFFAPMGLGGHIDHIVLRNVALQMMKEGNDIVFYEDLPYAADYACDDIKQHALQIGCIAGIELDLFKIETGVTIRDKISLLSNYPSQMDTDTYHRVHSYSDRFNTLAATEYIWVPKRTLPNLQRILEGRLE